MKWTPGVALLLAWWASPAFAVLVCSGIFEFEDGRLSGRFRCHYQHAKLRTARATCHDGEADCDADQACDGICRFSLCRDAACTDPFLVTVPLRHGGRAPGRTMVRSRGTTMTFRCLPPRGACLPGTTTSTTVASTTSTTLPSTGCTATLSGAVDAVAPCTASLSTHSLLLPVFSLDVDDPAVAGRVAALLVGPGTGSYRLGQRMLLTVARLARPVAAGFQAVPGREGASADLEIDDASGSAVHGTLEATLPGQAGGPALHVQATF